MTPLETPEGFKYYESLESVRPEFREIHVFSLLQFFQLRGKASPELLQKAKDYAQELRKSWDKVTLSDAQALALGKKKWGILEIKSLASLEKNNLIPIPDLQYLIYAKAENRYYVHTYAGYNVDQLYFYYQDTHAEVNEAIEDLQTKVSNGTVYLLYTKQMIEDMKVMLSTVYKSHINGEGTIDYKDYIELLTESINLENYESVGEVTGYKTVTNEFNKRINEIWNRAHRKNHPPQPTTKTI